MKIEAKEGFTFKRIHDGFIMGEVIYLGIDYSTGEPREDKAEYYEEVVKIDNNTWSPTEYPTGWNKE